LRVTGGLTAFYSTSKCPSVALRVMVLKFIETRGFPFDVRQTPNLNSRNAAPEALPKQSAAKNSSSRKPPKDLLAAYLAMDN
ncbi:hypothetical protein, partial [uncultured Sutterella sp.]|uniref:hypothetical protein n=1 Tax=uncultured Sutterella sp. TaxID=286133 RepID=UPI00263268EB